MSVPRFVRAGCALLVICLLALAYPASTRGEKRLLARVEPNNDIIEQTAEIFDQGTGGFSATGSMSTARESFTATALQDGSVLVAGGFNGGYLNTADVYDPSTRQFSETAGTMSSGRRFHTATLLPSGLVLIAGGSNGGYLATAETYNPFTFVFTATAGSMTTARYSHTATLLQSGKVLIVGGFNGAALGSAELYDPSTGQFTATAGSLNAARFGHTATLLSDGKVLIAGGYGGSLLNSAEIFDPATDKFTAVTGTMTAARLGHTATLLSDGKVLIAGGYDGNYLDSAEIYDPGTNSFAATSGKMSVVRQSHTAVRLADGKVLIAGGRGTGSVNETAEIYDPSSRTFTLTPGKMTAPRTLHAAAPLPDGTVLVAGGEGDIPLVFDVNIEPSDNVSPNIVFGANSKEGFVAYAGSGVVLGFSAVDGSILARIKTGGKPSAATPFDAGQRLAVVSVFEDKIFVIDTVSKTIAATYTFANAQFGFGSVVTVSPDGRFGYVSSTGTGEVIKFSLSDGKEAGRAQNLQQPAQITVTNDGATLLVVDTGAEELVFIDSSSLARKNTLKSSDVTVNFTMFNKAVLAPDGATGIIASQDLNEVTTGDTVIHFKTATAEILETATIGVQPGYTKLTPDGKHWVILCEFTLSVISAEDFEDRAELPTLSGEPLGSATIAFSPDSRYVYYPSSAADLVFQHDIVTGAVVGRVLVGDSPNFGLDQPAAVTLNPDGKTLAVVELASNNLDLLTDVTVLYMPRLTSEGNRFSGLSLVNLSISPANLTLYAVTNVGSLLSDTDIENPKQYTLQPNEQLSLLADQIFSFDYQAEHDGWVVIYSDQPEVVGYSSVGKIKPQWLGYSTVQFNVTPIFRQPLYDWIVPEIQFLNGESTELNLVDSNYNDSGYAIQRYSRDGTPAGTQTILSVPALQRNFTTFNDLYPTAIGGGRVLIAGGKETSAAVPSAELYNPSSGSVTATSSGMTSPREGHTATLMGSGLVLLAGGKNGATILSNAETYDLASDTFTQTIGPMNAERYHHTATLLPNGKVLLTGGQNSVSLNDTGELYDPATGTFSSIAAKMVSPRDSHTATSLPDGRVLLTGGSNGSTVVNTAEIYDPATETFKPTGTMADARAFHTATLLSDGRVLIAGGFNGSYLNTAEIYDTATGVFTRTATSMVSARSAHAAALLTDGRVLIAGGMDGSGVLNTAEIFNPATGSFSITAGVMTASRKNQTATLLSGGYVLIVGGSDGTNPLSSIDLFDPETEVFGAGSSMSIARESQTATLLGTASGDEGSLRITAGRGMLFTEFFGQPDATAAINGIELGRYQGVNRIVAPHVATVPGFKTIVNVINAHDQDAKVTFTLHRPDGSIPVPPVTRTLTKNSQLKEDVPAIFQEDPAARNMTGWLEITSDVDQVVGTATFTNEDGAFQATYELSGTPLSDFIYPLAAQDSTYATGVAILNDNPDPATVTVELWGQDSILVRSATLTLNGGSDTALYLTDIFPNLGPRLVSNLRIRSNRPVHSIAVINDRNFSFLSAMPPIPMP